MRATSFSDINLTGSVVRTLAMASRYASATQKLRDREQHPRAARRRRRLHRLRAGDPYRAGSGGRLVARARARAHDVRYLSVTFALQQCKRAAKRYNRPPAAMDTTTDATNEWHQLLAVWCEWTSQNHAMWDRYSMLDWWRKDRREHGLSEELCMCDGGTDFPCLPGTCPSHRVCLEMDHLGAWVVCEHRRRLAEMEGSAT
jgi:hypothetical protein